MIGLYLPLAAQTAYFLEAVLLGAAVGLLYDGFAAIRTVARARTGLTALCDGLFWLVTLSAYFVFTVVRAGGQVRGFLLLGCALGALGFQLTLSAWTRPALTALLGGAARLVHALARLAGRVLTRLCAPVRRLVGQGTEKFSKKFKKTLPFHRKKV